MFRFAELAVLGGNDYSGEIVEQLWEEVHNDDDDDDNDDNDDTSPH
jgi:hypothetical protein